MSSRPVVTNEQLAAFMERLAGMPAPDPSDGGHTVPPRLKAEMEAKGLVPPPEPPDQMIHADHASRKHYASEADCGDPHCPLNWRREAIG